MWNGPQGKGFFRTFIAQERCGHMFGLSARLAPLASMNSATRGADHISRFERSAKDGLSRFGISPLWNHRLLVHLASAGYCAGQPVRIRFRPHALTASVAASIFRYVPPFVRRAQMTRAVLLASATATTLYGRRARIAVTHFDALVLPRACRRTEVAPSTSSERSSILPIFDIFPKRSLPPLE